MERTGMKSLQALCEAVSQTTQTHVEVGTVPLNLFIKSRVQLGGDSSKARDVLNALLDGVKGGGNLVKSGGNLSWQLFYDPGMKFYVLNVHQVIADKN